MTDPNHKPHRAPPVSFPGIQQNDLGSTRATIAMQRAADAMFATAQAHARRYSNDDGGQGPAHQSGRPKSTRGAVEPLTPSGGHDLPGILVHNRGTSSPGSEAKRYSREAFPNLSTCLSSSDAIQKAPDPATSAFSLGSERRRRNSTRGSSFTNMSARDGEFPATNNSTDTLTGNLRTQSNSTTQVDTTEKRAPGFRRSLGPHHRSRDHSRAPGSTSSLPVDVGKGPVVEHAHQGTVSTTNDSKATRASDATTLPPPSSQTPPPDRTSVPVTIQIGPYIYIRQDEGSAPPAELPQDSTEKTPPDDPPSGQSLTLLHEIAFVFVIAAAQALMLAGVSQALIPATIIGSTFDLYRPADFAWFSASYALTSGTFVLPAGRLGDLFGHKRIFIIGFFWFAAWSFITGFSLQVYQSGANGLVFFNVCRALQGIGPALQVPNGQAMLGRAYKPGPHKALVMCLFGAAAPFGFVAGGAMSSLFAQLLSWPWSFWVLAAVCVAFGSMSILVLPDSPVDKRDKSERLWTQLDMPGILLGVSGLVLFNFAWNQAARVTWGTPYTYFILIISLLLISAFVYVELQAKYPLVPISAMRFQTNFILATTAAGWGCFSVWVFYSFQYLEVLRGWTPLLAAASHGPGPLTGLFASLLVARYMMRVGPHWIMLISMVAFFTGSLLMATAPVDQIYWGNTLFSVLIMPFGMDMSNPAATIILSNSVSKEHQGIAASLVVTVVNYSISTALGFAATIETNVNKGGTDILAGFRGAQYFGVGLGFLGCLIAFAFAMTTLKRQRAQTPPVEKTVDPPSPGASELEATPPAAQRREA
ncbi:putative Major facilitator superfamily (MFS) profile domain-containing protein [Seiridium cardinale]|uniref:Major facilitator superfamily (MFS) profile domain-containing protein n=1 Tax=Seiridium cardinale TaxID=138064 RepID=A0ABR2XG80_9PEZI